MLRLGLLQSIIYSKLINLSQIEVKIISKSLIVNMTLLLLNSPYMYYRTKPV